MLPRLGDGGLAEDLLGFVVLAAGVAAQDRDLAAVEEAPLPVRLLRFPHRRSQPLVPVIENLPQMPAQAGHRLGRARTCGGLRGRPPA